MSILSKERVLMIVFTCTITCLVIYFISGYFPYTTHPLLTLFFTVALSVLISGFIVNKIVSSEGK